MNPRNTERIHELCALIAVEQDRNKFLELVEELNRVLSADRPTTRGESASEESKDRGDDPEKS